MGTAAASVTASGLHGFCSLPEKAVRMLADPACRKYLVFSTKDASRASGTGQTLETPFLTSRDERFLLLPLDEREEHNSLGHALVGAIWFGTPVTLRLDTGAESLELRIAVHRCYLAGPLFTGMYQELREKNTKVVLASVWELGQTDV